jgi:NAD-dependent deacetylase
MDMFSNKLIEKLKQSKKVAVLTGAGISAESGVPTFRGEKGLWKTYKPEELASFNAFIKNPHLVWEWYAFRKKLINKVQPNPGHIALSRMERLYPEFTLITQNVDGLHWKAGNQNILELHGNIMRSRCIDCGIESNHIETEGKNELPRCACGGLMRPDVVWFGELLPQKILFKAFRAAENSELFFAVGTSAVVQPAASLPVTAKEYGAFVVEINTEPTVISHRVDEALIGPSGEILPKLLRYLEEGKN